MNKGSTGWLDGWLVGMLVVVSWLLASSLHGMTWKSSKAVVARYQDDTQISAQLTQMKNFILSEANDKAEEIKSKAAQEFTSEKGRIFQTEKLKIIKDYEKKLKQIEVQKKINLSNELNKARLSVLKVREECLREVVADAQKKLITIPDDKEKYTVILKNLVLQGMMKLREEKILVVCRQEDIALVEKAVTQAAAEYKTKTKLSVHVDVDKVRFLPPAPKGDQKGCSGGVIVTALEGRIICKNTLDARLEIAFEQLTPVIRNTLYGANPSRRFFD
ncbi:vacuolar H+-ATPase E subunit [Cavenderia fasciculata]|uniref:Vacuolar H+-ATPase E subunit n=1 Tax=Cavenderia fasciculata TaxID=261658 RepID=F4Q0Z7_CACFS|nr:vacuolar H+-ATPase E subunit [Cavenderia fasciculata]EGG18498.1 vacuolar H+-ATPase E subunit [Cavenderia fasciculata]|eukprot:XP_004366402.1 vacuolar H+-ATPase E subunit [Cavenderia fasciculata]